MKPDRSVLLPIKATQFEVRLHSYPVMYLFLLECLPYFTLYLFPQLGSYPLILFTVQMTLVPALLRIGYEVQQHLRFTSSEYLLIHFFYFYSHQLVTGLNCGNADSLQTGLYLWYHLLIHQTCCWDSCPNIQIDLQILY